MREVANAAGKAAATFGDTTGVSKGVGGLHRCGLRYRGGAPAGSLIGNPTQIGRFAEGTGSEPASHD
jgi:hypothetical protein